MRALLAVVLALAFTATACAKDDPTPAASEKPKNSPLIKAGKEQQVLGPTGLVDSLYATVKHNGKLQAYVSNDQTVWYEQEPDGTLVKPRVILEAGPKGSPDYCGVHPTGAIYKVTEEHWVSFYHGEEANPAQFDGECYSKDFKRNWTRWSVRELITKDAGKTWTKGEEVLTQDKDFVEWPTSADEASKDDAGSPRVVEHGDYLYMFYRAVNEESPDAMQMSVARAPKSSLGAPGSWKKYYHGEFSEDGLGGHQTAIDGLLATARGVSWNTHLKSYISVRVATGGIMLYKSDGEDLTKWEPLQKVTKKFADESAWGMPCDPKNPDPDIPAAAGYGATIGWDGSSSETGKNFWVYYMLKPEGECFSHRYLVRRQVTLDGTLIKAPKPTLMPALPKKAEQAEDGGRTGDAEDAE